MLTSTILGYPRIGPRRELKRALESYWDGRSTAADLDATGARLRAETWRRLGGLGLESLPSGTFSRYDQVLDTIVLLDAVPERFRNLGDEPTVYFGMARGADGVAPLRMTKWFDTNYHYIVPEIGPDTRFRLNPEQPVQEYAEARALGYDTRPVLLGPVTFLLLARRLDRLDEVVPLYAELLSTLASAGAGWVQLDEPALVADRTPAELAAAQRAYERLAARPDRPRIMVATYFGDPGEALPVLAATPVEAIGLDLVRGRSILDRPDLELLSGKTIMAGVVSGRDIWRTDVDDALDVLRFLRQYSGEIVVSSSCSLLHVPYSLATETTMDPRLRERLAFADEKVTEIVGLAAALARSTGVPVHRPERLEPSRSEPIAAPDERNPYPVRAAAQDSRLRLPELPVTTIGSFPQTGELRAARADRAAGRLDEAGYERRIEAEIERVIRVQERLGLDVLVHGEPERDDMVYYFAERLAGFTTTRNGWVQSYGSRCTRPPILYGDVSRPAPITVRWSAYAQSLTDRPVKGMLTGPVTLVAWSYPRRDLPLRDVVRQVAEAVREEVRDLEAAGIAIIQVDEPALRELLPLRRAYQDDYLQWAVAAYRRATSVVSDRTQIHTHLCYSDADQILAAIDALDADVTSVESARSNARLLREPAVARFGRGLGPGVYDIHSPRVPAVAEIEELLGTALRALPAERVWVNPDCGLKTRTYEQVEAALANVVAAARRVRLAGR